MGRESKRLSETPDDRLRRLQEQRTTVEKLREQGDLQALVLLLDHPEEYVRDGAIEAIGQIGGAGEAPRLLGHLTEAVSYVRVTVIQALMRLKYRPAESDLVQVLTRDKNSAVRINAAEALGVIGARSDEAVNALGTALEHDRDYLVRAYAAESLGLILGEKAVPLLLQRLRRERWTRTRASIMGALARLRHAGALRSLLRLLGRVEDRAEQKAVLAILQDLAGPENLSLIRGTLEDIIKRDPTFENELSVSVAHFFEEPPAREGAG